MGLLRRLLSFYQTPVEHARGERLLDLPGVHVSACLPNALYGQTVGSLRCIAAFLISIAAFLICIAAFLICIAAFLICIFVFLMRGSITLVQREATGAFGQAERRCSCPQGWWRQ